MKSIPLIAALLSLVAAAPAPVPHVSTQRMSEITRVLASDEFQGRAPGTPGEEKTIPYLIEQFQAAGLEPAGENGGWTQTVPMIRTKLQAPARSSLSAKAAQTTPLSFPDDIYLGTVRAVDRVRDRQRADGVRRLRRHRARARLGRFQGRRPAAARSRLPGQRSRLRGGGRRAGRGQVRRQGDDLLRPLDLQVSRKRRGAARSAR